MHHADYYTIRARGFFFLAEAAFLAPYARVEWCAVFSSVDHRRSNLSGNSALVSSRLRMVGVCVWAKKDERGVVLLLLLPISTKISFGPREVWCAPQNPGRQNPQSYFLSRALS